MPIALSTTVGGILHKPNGWTAFNGSADAHESKYYISFFSFVIFLLLGCAFQMLKCLLLSLLQNTSLVLFPFCMCCTMCHSVCIILSDCQSSRIKRQRVLFEVVPFHKHSVDWLMKNANSSEDWRVDVLFWSATINEEPFRIKIIRRRFDWSEERERRRENVFIFFLGRGGKRNFLIWKRWLRSFVERSPSTGSLVSLCVGATAADWW